MISASIKLHSCNDDETIPDCVQQLKANDLNRQNCSYMAISMNIVDFTPKAHSESAFSRLFHERREPILLFYFIIRHIATAGNFCCFTSSLCRKRSHMSRELCGKHRKVWAFIYQVPLSSFDFSSEITNSSQSFLTESWVFSEYL